MEKPMTEKEILTSTGSLGLEHRSHDRLYLNARFGLVGDVAFLGRQHRYAQDALGRGLATRCVGRYLVTPEVYEGVLGNEKLNQYLEAGTHVVNWQGEIQAHLVMFGMNHTDRRALEGIQVMVAHTSQRPTSTIGPQERIRRLRHDGIVFADRIADWMIPQIDALWVETFGWEPGQVGNLQTGLGMRTKWFSAAVSGDTVFSIAMAERLDIPLGDGRAIPIVESTEWRTRPGNERRGLMAGAVAYLNEQIVRDLQDSELPPLIVAETNYRSGAHHVGWATHMEVPDREGGRGPRQILVQNVEVVDGLEPRGLRDFTFMHLPFSILTNHYSYAMKGGI